MYVYIHDDHSNELLYSRELDDNDLLDCDLEAERFADAAESSIAPDTGIVPLGCGDLTVTLSDRPLTPEGYAPVVCWTAKSYFFETEQ